MHKRIVSLPAIITAAIAFLVYLLTMEPDLTWANYGGDGGELITAAVTFGVPHPPGYPTYVLIGNLFGRLPVGTVAFRFHLLSGVGVAVAAGFVAAFFPAINGRPAVNTRPAINGRATEVRPMNRAWGWLMGDWGGGVAAVSAGLAFAFAPLVWSQAIIAEVYGLNLAFVAAFLYVLVRRSNCQFDPQTDSLRYEFMVGLLLGLSITTHLTSILFLPMALLLIPVRGWLRLGGGIFVGLLPFLLLPLLAQSGSPVIWGQPDTLEGWWWLVSAQVYRPNVFGLPVSEWPIRLREWGLPLLEQFAYIGWPLLVLGIFSRIKKAPRLVIGLMVTALLYAGYAFTYRPFDAAVLFLPALLLLSIILGFGLQRLGRAAIILPLALLWLNLSQPENAYYVNQEIPVRPAVETLLENTPANAILLTPGDPTIAALWYFHHVEGKRPDIIIVDGNQFQFDWYREQLGRDYPSLEHLAQDDLPGFIEMNRQKRPVCEVSLVSPGYLVC